MPNPVAEIRTQKRWTFKDWPFLCFRQELLDPKAKMIIAINGKEYTTNEIVACVAFYEAMDNASDILFAINEGFKECPPDEETYELCRMNIDELIEYIEDSLGDYKCFQQNFLDEHGYGLKPMVQAKIAEFCEEIKKEKEEKKNARLDPVQK